MGKGIFFIILGALTLLTAIFLPVPFNGFIANWFYGFTVFIISVVLILIGVSYLMAFIQKAKSHS